MPYRSCNMERITMATSAEELATMVSEGRLHVLDKITAKRVIAHKLNDLHCQIADSDLTETEREALRVEKEYFVQIRREI